MTYSVDDVFIGYPASVTGRPYNQPTVLHYASDGTTLIETLTVPEAAATGAQQYSVFGIAVGTNGKLYVLWALFDAGLSGSGLGVFDTDGSWIGELLTWGSTLIFPEFVFVLPSGDLVISGPGDVVDHNNVKRYNTSGTLISEWPSPYGDTGWKGICKDLGSDDRLILCSNTDSYTLDTITGGTTGPVTLPIDLMTQSAVGIYSNNSAIFLLYLDTVSGHQQWFVRQLDSGRASFIGSASLVGEDGVISGSTYNYGLAGVPWVVSINKDGDLAWSGSFIIDLSRAGTPADSAFRTNIQSTVLPGGTFSIVSADTNGDINVMYVFQGFAAVGPDIRLRTTQFMRIGAGVGI